MRLTEIVTRPSRRAVPPLLAAALAVATGAMGCGEAPPPERVVLVTIDTLRLDTLLGSDERPTAMPRTLAWAEGGALFERFVSVSPVTQPAHASFLTGAFPWQHGVTANGRVLGEEHRTVPEVLAEEGWATGAVVASYPLTRRMGLGQGFGVYVDTLDERIGETWRGEPVDEFYSLAERVTDRALDVLERLDAPRRFLWVHYFDPHAPYGDAPGRDRPPVLGARFEKNVMDMQDERARAEQIERVRRLYEHDATSLDGELARLLEALASDGVPTHVVLVADHGESFGEDGSLGHGLRLSPPQLVVPLVVRSPRVAPGRRDDPVGSVDVAATLLALAGSRETLGGRDLTGPPGPGLVAGMRATFTGTEVDRRLDGSDPELEGDRWFAVVDGAIRAGDAGGVFTDDDEARPAPDDVASEARALFEIFAAERTGARTLDDPATRAALEALGYAE